MIVVAALFTSADELDWKSSRAQPFLQGNAEKLSELAKKHQVWILTDQPALKTHFGNMRFRTTPPQGNRLDNDQINTIVSCMELAENTSIAVLNLHCPFIEPSDLLSAIKKHVATDITHISIRPSEPSPCQIERHFDILQAGSVHLISGRSGDQWPASWLISKKFPFPWSVHTQTRDAKIFLRSPGHQKVSFIPLDNFPRDLKKDEYVFIRESDFEARLGIPCRETSRAIHLSNHFQNHDLMTFDIQNEAMIFRFPASSLDGKLTLMPFDHLGPLPHEQFIIRTSGKERHYPVEISNHFSGFLYTLTRTVSRGPVQNTVRFDPGGVLWQDGINLQTRQVISGRQSCPETFNFSEEFVVGKVADLNDLERAMAAGRVIGIRTSRPLLRIHSPLDILRARAITRARTTEQACRGS